MAKLKYYMHDGANWQARAVLAYLQYSTVSVVESEVCSMNNKTGHKHIPIFEVGRYENCREQGYVVSLLLHTEQIHIAFYEHRNSDNICILMSQGFSMNTPSIEFMWKDRGENASKYDYNKDFQFGQIVECGEYIEQLLLAWIGEVYEKEEKKEQ